LDSKGRHQDGKRDNNAFHSELQLINDTRGKGVATLDQRTGSRTGGSAHADTPHPTVKPLS
jgi:hypothetical protein